MSQVSVEFIESLLGYNMKTVLSMIPEITDMINRKCPSSYDTFVSQIDKDLNNIIIVTESGRKNHMSKGEDEITNHIISQLKLLYFPSNHDAENGGHCDYLLEAKSADGQIYQWVAEAKLWKGVEYVYGGLSDQLLNSYAKGGVNHCKGGLIFYSKLTNGAINAMNEWRRFLQGKGIEIYNSRKDNLRFDSKHQLNRGCGSDFFVSHYCVDVFHEPTKNKIDKAKRKRKDNK